MMKMAAFDSRHHERTSDWQDGNNNSNLAGQSKSSLEAAAEAAAKVNAMLIAKGKLKPSQVTQHQSASKRGSAPANLIVAEVDINDVPINCRNLLTRGVTQEEISRFSGAAVSTRGRYLSMEERMKNPGERALYLCVQGPTKESVDLAVKRIDDIITNGLKQRGSRFSPVRPPVPMAGPRPPHVTQPPPLMSLPAQPPGITVIQEKLYIGLEHAPPTFDVKNKILGPGGSFLLHIQNESGAKVTLRGKGSGFIEPTSGREAFEPMHVHLEHPVIEGIQQAKQLAENLIQTVQQEYAQFQQALVAMQPMISAGPPTLIAGIQQQPPVGGPMLTTQPGIPVQQPPMGAGLQPVSGPPPMLGSMLSASTPSYVLPSGSLATSIPSSLMSVTQTSAPNMIISPGLGTSLAPLPMVSSIPITVNACLPQSSLASQVDVGGHTLLPNTSIPPPMLQPVSTTSVSQYEITNSENQILVATTVAGGQPTHVIVGQPPQPMAVAPIPQPMAQVSGIPVSATGVQPTMQLVSQMVPPPGLPPPPGPGSIPNAAQMTGPPPPAFLAQFPASTAPPQSMVFTSSPSSVTYTMTSTGYAFTSPVLKEESHKRRFTEEKPDEKIPDNLFGYQHGPPHLVNLMQSGPPPPGMQHQSPNSMSMGPPDFSQEDSRSLMNGPNKLMHMVQASPPPSTSPDRTDLDKQLMPPPSLPGKKRGAGAGWEPEKKKMRGALGNVAGYGSDEEEEGGTSPTRQQQREQQKLGSLHSGKPQAFSQANQPPPAPTFHDQFGQPQLQQQSPPPPPSPHQPGQQPSPFPPPYLVVSQPYPQPTSSPTQGSQPLSRMAEPQMFTSQPPPHFIPISQQQFTATSQQPQFVQTSPQPQFGGPAPPPQHFNPSQPPQQFAPPPPGQFPHPPPHMQPGLPFFMGPS